MRIVYITDAFAVWGGMERVLTDKMNYLTEQYGYDVCLVTINQGNHRIPYELHPNVLYTDLNIRMHQQYFYHGINRLIKRKELQRLLKQRINDVIEELLPDIIICVKFDFIDVLLDVKGDVPLIIESHTICKSEYIDGSGFLRRLHVRLWKRKIRKANAVVVLTDGDANDWKKINQQICIIPNIVHINESGYFSSLQNKSVIYVGRFSHQKDIDSLLRIWEIVHKRHSDWYLDIYGEGELKGCYLPVVEKMNANIRIFDPTAEIMDKYCEHSVLLLTSLYEPFGLVLPEAMSCGLPVVSFDCPYGPADIITDGADGFLIKDRSIERFSEKVCQLIENETLRIKMGQAAILSSKRYSSDKIMPQWKALFDKLVNL